MAFSNKYYIEDGVAYITISRKGLENTATVDAEDINKLISLDKKWHGYINPKRPEVFYVITRKGLKLHRVITDAPEGMVVDHRDGDGLNNCKSNLRVCTNQQNLENRVNINADNVSGYRGVSWHKHRKKWQANYTRYGVQHYLGLFDTPEEAGAAAAAARAEYLPFSSEFREAA